MFSSVRGSGRRKAALWGGAAGAAVLIGSVCTAVPASAGTNIDSIKTGGSSCQSYKSNYAFCLWYSQNLKNGVWGATGNVSTISSTFANGGFGASGVGQSVRNNAASAAASDSGYCNVNIWVSPGYVGASNTLGDWWGGNLNSSLRNNEASVNIDNC